MSIKVKAVRVGFDNLKVREVGEEFHMRHTKNEDGTFTPPLDGWYVPADEYVEPKALTMPYHKEIAARTEKTLLGLQQQDSDIAPPAGDDLV